MFLKPMNRLINLTLKTILGKFLLLNAYRVTIKELKICVCLIKILSEILNPNTFDRFYERISYVPIPFFFNGFTDATLLIFINSNERKSFYKKRFYLKLLFDTAALIITLLYESNHFIRRFLNMGKRVADVNTGENFFNRNSIKNIYKDKKVDYEGGKIMSTHIFGDAIINSLNIYQVCFLLDAEKWKLNFTNFKEEFMNINHNNQYVRETLNKLEVKFEDQIVEEIKEIFDHEEEFTEICKQTVYCEYTGKQKKYQSIEIGRCLIDLGRQENPNYKI